MKISEPVLLDSNILVYAHNFVSPLHKKSTNLLRASLEGELNAVIAHQNLLEFYSIITDQRRIEKPISGMEASSLVKKYLDSTLEIIFPNPETVPIVLQFSSKLAITDGRIFDTYLVATMLSNNISSILTANTKDFHSFTGIQVFDIMKV